MKQRDDELPCIFLNNKDLALSFITNKRTCLLIKPHSCGPSFRNGSLYAWYWFTKEKARRTMYTMVCEDAVKFWNHEDILFTQNQCTIFCDVKYSQTNSIIIIQLYYTYNVTVQFTVWTSQKHVSVFTQQYTTDVH